VGSKLFVLGTSAFPGSGQDEFADLLRLRLPVVVYRSGDLVRGIARERGVEATRDNLQQVRRELDAQHGRGYLPEKLADQIDGLGRPAIITGIRTLEEEVLYRERFDFRLLFVHADETTRCTRVLKRGEAKDPSTVTAFSQQMLAEAKLFDVAELRARADEEFECGMLLDDFRRDFDRLVSPLSCVRELADRMGTQLPSAPAGRAPAVALESKRVLAEPVLYAGGTFEILRQDIEVRKAGYSQVVGVEVARRSPGVRVLMADSGRVMVIREYRVEHGGWDYRLPGGKVYDKLERFRASIADGRDMTEEARIAAAKELEEEAGLVADELKLIGISSAGASVIWDLYYFHCPRWRFGSTRVAESDEIIYAEWVSSERLIEMCYSGEVREDRTASVVLRFFLNKGRE
jgi:8-oxo-dGTP pyrophosphatase MutT (NUDIX family)/dephospho-CoA kinase